MKNKFDTIYDYDRQILADKYGKKAYVCTSYAMGVAIGFSLLVLFLPDPQGVKRAEAMIGVFHTFSFSLIGYSVFMGFSMVFLKSNLKLILFIMNWFIFPAIIFAFAESTYNILTEGHA